MTDPIRKAKRQATRKRCTADAVEFSRSLTIEELWAWIAVFKEIIRARERQRGDKRRLATATEISPRRFACRDIVLTDVVMTSD